MKGTLTLINTTLAYGDTAASSNPTRRFVDWSYSRSYSVDNPKSIPYDLQAGESLTIFDGVQATSVANDTEFQLTLNPLDTDTYRFTHSAGTAPALRTNRALALSGNSVTIVANANQTVTVTSGLAAGFASVVVGDTVFIPGTSTGDTAGPFSSSNEGYWVVLAKDSSTVIILGRPTGDSFLAAGEVVAVTANSQFQAFSAAGVQLGDAVDISLGFPSSVLKKYTITGINPSWFEVSSTSALPIGIEAVPTTSGIIFYKAAKRYVKVVVDQEAALTVNGVAGAVRLSPWIAGDPDEVGVYEQCGAVWSLAITNRSQETLNVLVITAE